MHARRGHELLRSLSSGDLHTQCNGAWLTNSPASKTIYERNPSISFIQLFRSPVPGTAFPQPSFRSVWLPIAVSFDALVGPTDPQPYIGTCTVFMNQGWLPLGIVNFLVGFTRSCQGCRSKIVGNKMTRWGLTTHELWWRGVLIIV